MEDPDHFNVDFNADGRIEAVDLLKKQPVSLRHQAEYSPARPDPGKWFAHPGKGMVNDTANQKTKQVWRHVSWTETTSQWLFQSTYVWQLGFVWPAFSSQLVSEFPITESLWLIAEGLEVKER